MSLSDADAYDRFMGRYSRPLAVPFADFAGLPLDGRVLDVGCGPGALTAELARRARPGRVTAVDPSEEFVAALRGRHPGVQVIRAPAEDLPFEGGCFDATLAQLVVNVMDDPVAGLREMARVTRDGGVVAACVWDFTDGGPMGPFRECPKRSILVELLPSPPLPVRAWRHPRRTDRAAVGEVPQHGRTPPPSRVTLAISRRPATGSSMTLTTSWASVASKQPRSNGRSQPAPG